MKPSGSSTRAIPIFSRRCRQRFKLARAMANWRIWSWPISIRDVGTLRVRTRKGDGNEREYYITLTDEGSEFFELMCAGRTGDELIFLNNGRDWRKSEQTRPMVDAAGQAKINPLIGFNGLRHTWASLAVMAGMPLLIVAANLGHSDTRMVEKHYGHLAPSYIAQTTRQYAPRFGAVTPSNVMPL
jgi:integrase